MRKDEFMQSIDDTFYRSKGPLIPHNSILQTSHFHQASIQVKQLILNLEENLTDARKAYASISSTATKYATVLTRDGDNLVIGSQTGELFKVNYLPGISPGDTVYIAESGQIGGKSSLTLGNQIARILSIISPTLAEVELPGGSRGAFYENKVLRVGDRVLLDNSSSVILQVLPDLFTKKDNFQKVLWEDIVGCAHAKKELLTMLTLLRKESKLLEAYGLRVPKGFLMYGPPGTGKTMLAKACATELGGNFIYISGTEILSKWVGDSEARIRDMFMQARHNLVTTGQRSIIFIDEADAILGKRGGNGGLVSMEKTIVPTFLTEMDGLEDSPAIVILATNRPDTLDPAIVREGRLDKKILIDYPTFDEAKEVLILGLKGAPQQLTLIPSLPSILEEKWKSSFSAAALIAITHTARQIAAERDAGAKSPSGISSSDLSLAFERH